jgi:hypothetical protein
MRLRKFFSRSEVETAFFRGWQELENGMLLAEVEQAGFEVFVTADKNLSYQQNLVGRQLAILVVSTNDRKIVYANARRIEDAVLAISLGGFLELDLENDNDS